jgi:IclR family acetate operon transcriptional repressor
MGQTDTVRAIETSTRILDGLEALGGEATIADLDRHLSLSKSTIYKHLNTLRTANLVTKSGDEYRFGLRFLELGGYAREYDDIFSVAKPEVRQMAEETGEVANLVFEEGGMAVYVFTAKGGQAVELDTHLGKRVGLHSTGLGKALLATLSDEEIQTLVDERGLDRKTDHTITDEVKLFQEIEAIREEGIAYDTEEHIRGMGCVAAPIEVPGRRRASISVTGPVSRVTTEELQHQYTQIVRRAANVIELNLSSQ